MCMAGCMLCVVALNRNNHTCTHTHMHHIVPHNNRHTHVLIHIQVRELAHMINPGLEVITCGSYRRGKPTCGDVDILVTHGDGRSHRGVLPRLVQEGKESGEPASPRGYCIHTAMIGGLTAWLHLFACIN